MNICIECKHCIVKKLYSDYRCERLFVSIDRVSGFPHYPRCEEVRNQQVSPDKCSGFEKKVSWISRLFS